jgi:hypothetical protein
MSEHDFCKDYSNIRLMLSRYYQSGDIVGYSHIGMKVIHVFIKPSMLVGEFELMKQHLLWKISDLVTIQFYIKTSDAISYRFDIL